MKDSCQILLHITSFLLSKEVDSATQHCRGQQARIWLSLLWTQIDTHLGTCPSVLLQQHQSLRLSGLFLHKSHLPMMGIQWNILVDVKSLKATSCFTLLHYCSHQCDNMCGESTTTDSSESHIPDEKEGW